MTVVNDHIKYEDALYFALNITKQNLYEDKPLLAFSSGAYHFTQVTGILQFEGLSNKIKNNYFTAINRSGAKVMCNPATGNY